MVGRLQRCSAVMNLKEQSVLQVSTPLILSKYSGQAEFSGAESIQMRQEVFWNNNEIYCSPLFKTKMYSFVSNCSSLSLITCYIWLIH